MLATQATSDRRLNTHADHAVALCTDAQTIEAPGQDVRFRDSPLRGQSLVLSDALIAKTAARAELLEV